jgi:hypothetical protein
MSRTATYFAVMMMALASGAHAQETYVMGSWGQTDITFAPAAEAELRSIGANTTIDAEDTGYAVGYGYRGALGGGLEFSYMNLGEFTATAADASATVEAATIALAATYTFDLAANLALMAKLGAHRWELEAPITQTVSDEGTSLLAGVHISYRISQPVDIFVGHDHLDDLSYTSIGARFYLNP